MNQSRRRFGALLAASLSGLAGCGTGSGNSDGRSDPDATPTAGSPSDQNIAGGDPTEDAETPAPTSALQLVAEPAETASVPNGAAVGLLPAPVTDALDEAIADPPAPTGLREDVELALEALDGVTYAEGTYAVDARFVDGNVWYETNYEMHPTDEPSDDEEFEMIIVDDLPEGERAAVVEAIETGSYTYDSIRDEHDIPRADVYRYEGEFYALGQVWHGDFGPTLGLLLEPVEAEDGDRSVALEALGVGATAAPLFERAAAVGSVSLEGAAESTREAITAVVDDRELFTDGVAFYRVRIVEAEA